jgi:Outer membrane protein (OmpH-like).
MKHEIGYVDMVKVLNASSVGKQEAKHNQRVLEVLKTAQKEAQDTYGSMPEEQRKKSALADAQILNNQWAVEQKHAREVSVKAIMAATESWRQRHHLRMVVDSRQVIAADPEADITQAIITELATAKVEYGDLPQVSIKKSAAPEAPKTPVTEPEAQTAPQADHAETPAAQ